MGRRVLDLKPTGMLLELDLGSGSKYQLARPRVVRLPNAWRVVRRVRTVVDKVLEEQPDIVRQAVRLVASELLENVIKYGEMLPDGSQPVVAVQLSDGMLIVRSRNGVASDHDVQRITEILERIRSRRDIEAVYIEAILQAMATRRQSASLGLMRIAAEAGFELTATFEAGVLEIVARKGIS